MPEAQVRVSGGHKVLSVLIMSESFWYKRTKESAEDHSLQRSKNSLRILYAIFSVQEGRLNRSKSNPSFLTRCYDRVYILSWYTSHEL